MHETHVLQDLIVDPLAKQLQGALELGYSREQLDRSLSLAMSQAQYEHQMRQQEIKYGERGSHHG